MLYHCNQTKCDYCESRGENKADEFYDPYACRCTTDPKFAKLDEQGRPIPAIPPGIEGMFA